MVKRNLNAQDHRRYFGKKQCFICGKTCPGRRRHYCSDKCGHVMQELVNSTTWNLVKEKALQRDKQTCRLCGNDITYIKDERGELSDKVYKLHHIILEKLKNGKTYPEIHENMERIKLESKLDYLETHTFIVDHIIPIAMGGDPFNLENLQTLCIPCNRMKTTHDLRSLKYFKRCRTDDQKKEFAVTYLKTLTNSKLCQKGVRLCLAKAVRSPEAEARRNESLMDEYKYYLKNK